MNCRVGTVLTEVSRSANALKQLKAISLPNNATSKKTLPKSTLPDCCICLFAVTIHQALFIAPCSHAFHYKCIRPLLETHHPAFSCPLCRTFANLEEEDVDSGGGKRSGSRSSGQNVLVAQFCSRIRVYDRDSRSRIRMDFGPYGISGNTGFTLTSFARPGFTYTEIREYGKCRSL